MKCALLTTVDVSMSWFMLPYAYELKKRGVDVTLICNMTDAFSEKYSGDFECIPVRLTRGFHLTETISAVFRLFRLFREKRFDMIEYATENVALPASIAGWLCRIPVRIYDEWGILFEGFSGIRRTLAKMIERIVALFSTDLRQVSEKNKELGVKNHLYRAEKVKVLGRGGTIGVDFERFRAEKKQQWRKEIREAYHVPQDAALLGFVGRIQRDKGINELIEAFRKLIEEGRNVCLMLVGFVDTANPVKEENMVWAQNCPNVVFTGRVNDAERYMASFDLLVHPTYREGFGMVLQEAGAVKTPIVTTNIIGPSEFITDGQNGRLVEPKNSESLYSCIRELLEAPQKRADMAEACYRFTKEHFERTVMVGRMVEDRLDLIEKKRVRTKP